MLLLQRSPGQFITAINCNPLKMDAIYTPKSALTSIAPKEKVIP